MHDELAESSHFSRAELQAFYRKFKDECPSGHVNKAAFTTIYADLVGKAREDVSEYAGETYSPTEVLARVIAVAFSVSSRLVHLGHR